MTRCVVRRTGNSLGVVLPRELVREKGLKEGDEVEVVVEKAKRIQEMWGALKGRGPSVRELHALSDEGEDVG
jgi:antitoxin component of MazEF toxin-antitoxin module